MYMPVDDVRIRTFGQRNDEIAGSVFYVEEEEFLHLANDVEKQKLVESRHEGDLFLVERDHVTISIDRHLAATKV